jgi:lipid-A-disaccharide synthase-like uncharacterized protein
MTSALASLLSSVWNPWIIIGFAGQFIFFMRFIVQWLASEKEERVVVPVMFWYLSIAGSLIILAYSIHIKDIVFITAQLLSLVIYVRNLMFEASVARQSMRKSDTNAP